MVANGVDLFDLGPEGVSIEALTTRATVNAADACFPADGPVGTTVLSLDLPRPGYLGLSVEPRNAGFATQASVRRNDCQGAIIACWSAPAGSLLDVGQDVPAGRIVIEITRGSDVLSPPVDEALDVWLAAEGREDCADGLDNDADDSVDCQDPVCFFDPVCQGGHLGEACADAIPIPVGEETGVRYEGYLYSTFSGRTRDLALPESCPPKSRFGNDVFFSFTTGHGASSSLVAYAFSDKAPTFLLLPLVVIPGGCDQPPLSCHDPESAGFYSNTEVPGGTTYIIVRPPSEWPASPYEPNFTLQYVITPLPPP